MTADFLPFACRAYGLLFVLLLVARGMDILSTWIATPTMVLEGNPVAKKLGWRWGIVVNLVLCFGLAFWVIPAIVISTTSLLVAARNFQSAWLMRTLGEYVYREWHVARMQETSATLYLSCLFGQTVLTGAVGLAVMYFSGLDGNPILGAIGLGILAYAVAVTFYTLLAMWRLRRATLDETRFRQRANQARGLMSAERANPLRPLCPGDDLEPSGK